MTLCAPHGLKQGSPPGLRGKFLFVEVHNSRTDAAMVKERAFDQPLVVSGTRPLHDGESLGQANAGRAQQYKPVNLFWMAGGILDGDLRTETACNQVIGWRL